MLNLVSIVLRGRSAEAGERFAEANALTILDQQVRESAAKIEGARRALAISLARAQFDAARVVHIEARISDLEAGALAALEGGREDLAAETAATIARLEADRDVGRQALAALRSENERMRAKVEDSEDRLRALEHGRRIARAAEASRGLRAAHASDRQASLRDAEATLVRLRTRQREGECADDALSDLEGRVDALDIVRKLDEAGFSASLRPNAQSVLERLKARQAAI